MGLSNKFKTLFIVLPKQSIVEFTEESWGESPMLPLNQTNSGTQVSGCPLLLS